ncbi:MAG TPA: hypothetical protein VIM89_18545 [Mucilaginibacter sp.]
MRKFYIPLLASLLVCSFTACKKGSDSYNASKLIIGKWNLQQQKTVIYVNGIKQIDTVYSASVFNAANARFNSNGTFSSVGYFHYPGTESDPLAIGLNNVAGVDSTYGNYSIVNSSLNISQAMAGFSNMVGFYDAATSPNTLHPVNVVSRSSQINQLTSSQFKLHYELIYNIVIDDASSSYKEEEDYYYTR